MSLNIYAMAKAAGFFKHGKTQSARSEVPDSDDDESEQSNWVVAIETLAVMAPFALLGWMVCSEVARWLSE